MASHQFQPQADPNLTVPLWINGHQETPSPTFPITSPLLDATCWAAPDISTPDILKAISSPQAAFHSWRHSKPAARSTILLKTASILESNAAEYAGYMATEMGAELDVAQFFVLPLAVQMLRDIAGRALTICGSVPVCQQEGQSAIVYKEPYGVTLGIVPWYVAPAVC
jgi:acyl-CoA reductase-like NAD-dependent aldehyde dehydrogenase